MHNSVICAVQTGSTWQTRECSRGLLGWRLGDGRIVSSHTATELISALASGGRRGVIAIAIGRDNLLVRSHERSDSPAGLFPSGEELIYWRREVVIDGVPRTESIGLRRSDAANLHREAHRVGFSRCVLFPMWIAAIAGARSAKPGTILEFDSGILERRGNAWSQWRRGARNETERLNAVMSGVDNALSGGLLLAVEDRVPPGWSSGPSRRREIRWTTAAFFLIALLVAFSGQWNWLGRQIASERAVLEELRSTQQAQARLPGCAMAQLMATLQMIGQAAGRDVTATMVAYSLSAGISVSGIGSSPSRIRAFLKDAGISDNTISLTARGSDFLFRMEGSIQCDH